LHALDAVSSSFLPGFIAAPLDGETAFVVRNGAAISGSPTRLEFG
jgi:hypothetical protein